MTRILIRFLQSVLVLIGIISIAILITAPLREGRATNLSLLKIYADPFIVYLYIASITFFTALYQAFKLLTYISQSKVFTPEAIQTLKNIKYCGIVLCCFIFFAGLYIKIFHSKEDDPAGFLALCFLSAFASIIVATAAGIFQNKFKRGVDMIAKI